MKDTVHEWLGYGVVFAVVFFCVWTPCLLWWIGGTLERIRVANARGAHALAVIALEGDDGSQSKRAALAIREASANGIKIGHSMSYEEAYMRAAAWRCPKCGKPATSFSTYTNPGANCSRCNVEESFT